MQDPPGVRGPDCEDFPTGIAAAPVTWLYYDQEIKLEFKAGFLGASQDPATGTIRPLVGWYIAYESKLNQDHGDETSSPSEPVCESNLGADAISNGEYNAKSNLESNASSPKAPDGRKKATSELP